jgi:hypothetical protein
MDGTDSYWVHISRGGNWLGAGFLLLGSYVLTAHHCLGKDEPGSEDVKVEFESGEVLPGRIHRRCPEADLALIDVPESGRGPVIPRAGRPNVGEKWRSPYQPSRSDVFLSGMIDAVHSSYECAAGDRVEAMQLGCKQDLEDYAGYSGSPIESDGSNKNKRLFGVLIEQHPKHFPASREPRAASPVLFATTMTEVMRRFDCFYVDHLIDLLPSSSADGTLVPSEKSGKPAAGGLAVSDVRSDIGAADEKIRALYAWYTGGLLDEQEFTAIKIEVIRLHLLGGDGGSGRE